MTFITFVWMQERDECNIILTGASGQVAFAISEVFADSTLFKVHPYSSNDLDIRDDKRLQQIIEEVEAKYLINTAAYTKVDLAEKEVEQAMDINGHALKRMAKICEQMNCHLIHLSSDYVYDSINDRPIQETDPTTPKSIYAQSKLLGDHNIMLHTSAYSIIRTSWVYGPNGRNFVSTMLKLAKTGKELSIVNDQIGSPTYSIDIARAIKTTLEQKELGRVKDISGIYNFSNDGYTNWYAFAQKIFEMAHLQVRVKPVSTLEFGADAVRPRWSVLSKERICSTFGVRLSAWEDSLFDYLRKYS